MDINLENLPEPLPADTSTETMAPTNQSSPKTAQRGLAADLALGLAHGVESAVVGFRETVRGTARELLPDSMIPDEMKTTLTTHLPAPETTLGKLESDLIRFGVAFVGANLVLPGSGLAVAGRGAAVSAASTVASSNPYAERLSNLVQDHPYLANPITEYLASDKNDSFLEGKFKSALEDIGLSGIAGLAFKTISMAKAALVPAHASTKATAAQTADDLAATIMAERPSAGAAGAQRAAKLSEKLKDDVGLNLSVEESAKFFGELDKIGNASESTLAQAAGKEGFLNVTKLQTGSDTKATVNRFGAILAPIMEKHGWTEAMTHKETLAAAELLGETPEMLLGGLRLLGKQAHEIAPTLVAGRMLLTSQADSLFSAATKARITGEGSKDALAQLKTFADTYADVKMIQTGAARATESGKIPVQGLNPDRMAAWLKTFATEDDALRAIQMTEGNTVAMAKLVRTMPEAIGDVAGAGWRTHNTYWINAILASPKTHVINLISTGTNAMLAPFNLIVGGGIQGLVTRDYSNLKEGLAVWHGMRTYLTDSFRMAAKAFKTEAPVLGGPQTIEDATKMTAIETSQSLWAKTVRFPSRMLGAEDELWKQLAYRSKLSAQAARQAADLLKAGHITENEVDDYIKTTFDAGFDKDGMGIAQDAMDYASHVTFTSDLKTATWMDGQSFGESFQQAAQSHPWLRGTILPFVRTPVNLFRIAVDYTPVLGQLRRQFYDDVNAGGVKQAEAIGRVVVGSSMWAGAVGFALTGRLTGAAPRDKELADQLRLSGWQPYSIVNYNEDGSKHYTSFQRFDPFGMFLGLAADGAQTMQHIPTNKAEDWAALAGLSLANNLMSKSYLTGITDVLSVLAGDNERQIEKYMERKVASYIPAVVNVAQADIGLKEIRSLMDAIMNKIPGLSSKLEPRRDLFGAKIMPQMGWPMGALNPFTSSDATTERVTQELARLAQSDSRAQFGRPQTTEGSVDLLAFKNAAGRTAYDRLAEESGKGLAAAMADVMQSARYQEGTDGSSYYKTGSRVAQLRELIDRHRMKAMIVVRREYPTLDQALRADRVNRTKVRHGVDELEILKTLSD